MILSLHQGERTQLVQQALDAFQRNDVDIFITAFSRLSELTRKENELYVVAFQSSESMQAKKHIQHHEICVEQG